MIYVHDYYEEKISPTPILIMDSINEDSCEEKGILILFSKIIFIKK